MFDLDSYIAKYLGETRLQRLLLVARNTHDEALAVQAFRLVEQQLKADGNVKRYQQVFGGYGYGYGFEQQGQVHGQSTLDQGAEWAAGLPPQQQQQQQQDQNTRQPSIAFDQDWVVTKEAANRNDRQVLQGRLSTAQSHLHKEAIRSAYLALAQHDIQTGELEDSLASLFRATEYSTSRSQTAQISLSILQVCLALQHYGPVREYVTKVEHTLRSSTSSTSGSNTSAIAAAAGGSPSSAAGGGAGQQQQQLLLQDVSIKLKIARGLERLAQDDFHGAANILTQLIMAATTSSTAQLEWPGVASAEDIALYASLLAVATQSRAEILQLAEHPEALELVPTMKEMLGQWSRANYGKCMEAFIGSSNSNHDSQQQHHLVFTEGDLYLTPTRWMSLRKKIKEKCVLEYLQPYQSVRLDDMMQLFPCMVDDLEDILVDLMGRGLIQNARIDARANVLYKSTPKPTVDLASMERRILDDTHAMLIRLACLEHDLCVHDPTSSSGNTRGTSAAGASAAHRDEDDDSDDDFDTPMHDADAASCNINMAANPEDVY